jgi:outer membrane protein assembly factor BamE (lipoprotein component of BamABCDE complex)
MKPVVMIAAVLLAGCATTTTQQITKQARQQSNESDTAPVTGMTKDQVLSRCGEPEKKTVTNEGEQWLYVLNMGEFIEKRMIPSLYSDTQVRTATIMFGPDGHVKKFNWDTPDQSRRYTQTDVLQSQLQQPDRQ